MHHTSKSTHTPLCTRLALLAPDNFVFSFKKLWQKGPLCKQQGARWTFMQEVVYSPVWATTRITKPVLISLFMPTLLLKTQHSLDWYFFKFCPIERFKEVLEVQGGQYAEIHFEIRQSTYDFEEL